MPIHRLYQDFFEFLDASTERDPWDAYRDHYLEKHRTFLESYWRNFPKMDEGVLRDRVRTVKKGDYAPLLEFERGGGFKDVRTHLDRCNEVIPSTQDPDVYLYVGFFSTEGAVVDVEGKPVITIGLERFRSFEILPVVLAHEYGHWIARISGNTPRDAAESRLIEGACVLLSMEAFPGFEEHHYFLIPHKRKLAEVKDTPIRPFETQEIAAFSPLIRRYWGYREAKKKREGGTTLRELLEGTGSS
jgi:hypothetical protein